MTTQDLHDARLEAKLRRELGIVFELLERKGTEDVVLNPDGKLWVKATGYPFRFVAEFTATTAMSAMLTIAHMAGVNLDANHPILETTLPFNGSRVEGLIPPIVSSPSFAMRPKAVQVYTLRNYVESGMLTETHFTVIETAIKARKNILTVGGTGSGKTTLSNALLDSMANLTPEHRVLIIEDTSELQCKVENSTSLLAAGSITMNDCLRACMRLKPDRIIVGEVRGPESLELLKAWNTGHPGGFATIHADDARLGLTRLESLVEEATSAPKQKYIAEAVNLLVFIAPDPSLKAGRRVKEVLRVVGYDQKSRTYEVVEE